MRPRFENKDINVGSADCQTIVKLHHNEYVGKWRFIMAHFFWKNYEFVGDSGRHLRLVRDENGGAKYAEDDIVANEDEEDEKDLLHHPIPLRDVIKVREDRIRMCVDRYYTDV